MLRSDLGVRARVRLTACMQEAAHVLEGFDVGDGGAVAAGNGVCGVGTAHSGDAASSDADCASTAAAAAAAAVAAVAAKGVHVLHLLRIGLALDTRIPVLACSSKIRALLVSTTM